MVDKPPMAFWEPGLFFDAKIENTLRLFFCAYEGWQGWRVFLLQSGKIVEELH